MDRSGIISAIAAGLAADGMDEGEDRRNIVLSGGVPRIARHDRQPCCEGIVATRRHPLAEVNHASTLRHRAYSRLMVLMPDLDRSSAEAARIVREAVRLYSVMSIDVWWLAISTNGGAESATCPGVVWEVGRKYRGVMAFLGPPPTGDLRMVVQAVRGSVPKAFLSRYDTAAKAVVVGRGRVKRRSGDMVRMKDVTVIRIEPVG